jgi:DNA polymerase-1
MSAGRTTLMLMIANETYDPEQLGARCSECVLKDLRVGGPVGPEFREDARISVIAESPGEKEVDVGRPLVGPAGLEFNQTLQAVGVRRQALNLHQAICCRPPENDLDKVMLKWQRGNKKLVKSGQSALPSPIECCRPRLIQELDGVPNVITLGKVAYASLTGAQKSILDIRGGPVEAWLDSTDRFGVGETIDPAARHIKVLPTLHPSFVLRTQRWRKAFRSDISRAARWFTHGLGWQEPHITLQPRPDELRSFLARTDITYTVDVETTIDDPMVAKLKTVGVGHTHGAMVVTFLTIEDASGQLVPAPYYTEAEYLEIRGIFRDFFIDPTRAKAGHNAGYFDQMVLKQHFGVTTEPMLDTILLHRVVEPELPHKLGYVGTVYTDVTAWKDAHTAKEAKSDRELAHYNAVDCVVTARVIPQLIAAAKEREQIDIVEKDHRVQQVCVGLHENGLLVDRAARDVVAKKLIADMIKYRNEAQRIADKPLLNLNSVFQLRDLLFEEWKIEPVNYTKLGDPSTDDESVRAMRTLVRAREDADKLVPFLDTLRKYRRVAKEYGTYVRRLVPHGQPLDGFQFKSEEEEEQSERGLIMADGRVRPDYNAHGTTSGRLSSSNPNAQNWPKHLRKLIIPAPGHVIVGADADQLELRIITAVAQIEVYLQAFADGKDPHAMTASLMFGKNFDSLVPKSDQWDKLRKIAKGIKYASFYGSGDETVHNLVTSAEDENGNLMYPDLSVREIATLRRRWLKGIPELPRWWDKTLESFRKDGYIRDPVWGRQRDFLDGEAFNEIVNHPIQSAGAHIIHESTFDLLPVIPFHKWGPGTGLISQVHDALYVEAPCSHEQFDVPKLENGKPDEKLREFGWCPPGCGCEANWAAREIEKAMNRAVLGLDGVEFRAKAKIGRTWADV